MHIPDGYLSPSTCLTFGAVMMPLWYRASAKVKQLLDVSRIPFMAMGAVFSFLLMMFNIPIPDGTTAHAVGAVVLALVLGVWPAVISMSIVLLIQALVFGDGGLLSYPVNAFNMAVIMPFAGYYTFRLLAGRPGSASPRQIAAAAIAGYVGLNIAALAAAVEFGIQPLLFVAADGAPLYCPYGLNISIPAMMFAHLTVAGFAEGAVTGLVYGYLSRTASHDISQSRG